MNDRLVNEKNYPQKKNPWSKKKERVVYKKKTGGVKMDDVTDRQITFWTLVLSSGSFFFLSREERSTTILRTCTSVFLVFENRRSALRSTWTQGLGK